tara:strand:+ start:638 stop:2482 length:1845 start_codon:yes stop_codon:yes gene_type:complete
MDKKNTILGILCLVAAFAIIPMMNKPPEQAPSQDHPAQVESLAPATSESASPQIAPATQESGLLADTAVEAAEEIANLEVTIEATVEELTYLENELVQVVFTNLGGGIKKVALNEYPARKDSEDAYLFNHYGYAPMMGVSVNQDAFDQTFIKTQQTETAIEYERQRPDGLLIRKKFWIVGDGEDGEPYTIRHSIEFVNTTSGSLLLNNYQLHLGTMEPALLDGAAFMGNFLNLMYQEDGDTEDITSTKFIQSSGFLGFGANRNPPPYISESPRFAWASLKNQFFLALLTPDDLGTGVSVRPVTLSFVNSKGKPVVALSSDAHFELSGLSANEKVTSGMDFYVGPKEIFRLQGMDRNQEAVMQFGWFGSVSKILLLGMKQIHSVAPNWGVAIIIITICLKLLFWPLTQISARSAKKMQKIQGPMKELTEKYKDDPKRKNEEMMKLYRKHKVNPLGGCLPIMIQIPIFIGFFYMIRTSSELRFAEFLWIADLSEQEKIFSWGIDIPLIGQYFNLLPILMSVTMYYQMRMTPTAASAEQQAIFKFMPVMMLVMLYKFSSGLCLYWTVQNLMTILQQTITNRRKDKDEIAEEKAAQNPKGPVENPLIRKKLKRKPKNR